MKLSEIDFKETSIFRIYFELGSKVYGTTFLQRLWGVELGIEIIKRAKKFGLTHAVNFNIKRGYINNEIISYGITEVPSPKHPQCVELAGDYGKIISFLDQNSELLKECFIIVYNQKAFERMRT